MSQVFESWQPRCAGDTAEDRSQCAAQDIGGLAGREIKGVLRDEFEAQREEFEQQRSREYQTRDPLTNRMKVRDVMKILANDGWVLKNQESSHRQFVHPTKVGKVTVPGQPGVDVPAGTLSSIMKRGAEEMKYPVVYEKSANGWGAYIPDLPGCVALSYTLDETKRLIREALEIHLRSMREDGDPIPEPSHEVDVLEVA